MMPKNDQHFEYANSRICIETTQRDSHIEGQYKRNGMSVRFRLWFNYSPEMICCA